MNGLNAFRKITGISDDLLMDAALDASATTLRPKSRTPSRLSGFFNSGLGVALICGVVAMGTLGAIVWAGHRPQTPPTPPVTTTQETQGSESPTAEETEPLTEVQTEALTNPENASVGLTFTTTGNGKCTVSGIGSCQDEILVIPILSPAGDKVTAIGPEAFRYCDQITEVIFPDTLTTIDAGAFVACDNLASVTIPDSVHTIGDNAFASCPKLENVAFEGTVIRNLGNYAFSDTGIVQIDLPLKQKKIPVGLFFGCASLETVTIPDTVTGIGDAAFMSCYRLDRIIYLGDQNSWDNMTKGNEWDYQTGEYTVQVMEGELVVPVEGSQGLLYGEYNDKNNTCYVMGIGTCTDKDIVIPTQSPEGYKVKRIYTNAFAGTDITSVTLHDNLTAILSGAFKDCVSLKAVYGTEGITNIYSEAFSGCTSLVDFDFSDRLTNIGESAFENTKLPKVTLGSSVKSIDDSAFAYCEYLTEITLPQECDMGAAVLEGCKRLVSVTLPKLMTSIGHSFFSRCQSLQTVVIPKTVTEIDFLAFYACANLLEIEYSGTVSQWNAITKDTEWDTGAFAYTKIRCSDGVIYKHSGNSTEPDWQMVYESNGDGTCTLTDQGSCIESYLTIPSTSPTGEVVTKIDGAFIFNTRLITVVIPEGVTEIGISTFNDCINLESVTIPASVTSIRTIAFENCESLTDIGYSGTMEEWNAISKHPDWNKSMPACTVHCTDGSITLSP